LTEVHDEKKWDPPKTDGRGDLICGALQEDMMRFEMEMWADDRKDMGVFAN
jgi:hypothetical protein